MKKALFIALVTGPFLSAQAETTKTIINPFTGKFDFITVVTSNTLPSGTTHYIQNRNTLQSGSVFVVSSGTFNGPFIVDRPDLTGLFDSRSQLAFSPNSSSPRLNQRAFNNIATSNEYAFLDPNGNTYGLINFSPQVTSSGFSISVASQSGTTVQTRVNVDRDTSEISLRSHNGTEMIRISTTNGLALYDSDASNYFAWKASETVSSNITITGPPGVGTSGQVLHSDGDGGTYFAADDSSAGSGTTIEIEEGGSSTVNTSTVNFSTGLDVSDDSGEALVTVDLTEASGLTADPQQIRVSTDGTQIAISTGINVISGTGITISGTETGNRADVTITSTLGTSIAAAEMADADHGDVAWSGGAATVQNVAAANIAAGSLDLDVIASSVAADAVGVEQLSASGTADNTTFLRGDNSWATPSGSGDAVLAATQTWTGGNTKQSWEVFNGSVSVNANRVITSNIIDRAVGIETQTTAQSNQVFASLYSNVRSTGTTDNTGNAAHMIAGLYRSSDTIVGGTDMITLEARNDARTTISNVEHTGVLGYMDVLIPTGPANGIYTALRARGCVSSDGDCGTDKSTGTLYGLLIEDLQGGANTSRAILQAGTDDFNVFLGSHNSFGSSTVNTTSRVTIVQPGGAAVTAGLMINSGGTGDYTYMGIGRVATEYYLGVSAAADQFLTGNIAGDGFIGTGSTGNRLAFASGLNASPEFVVANSSVVALERLVAQSTFYINGPLQLSHSAGTSGQVLTSNGSGTAPTWEDAAGGGTTRHNLLVEDAQFFSAVFPQYNKVNGTTVPVSGLAYDASTQESAHWKFIANDYTSGNPVLTIYWYADSASTGDVVWGAQIMVITPNTDSQDIETDAWATAQTVTDSHLGTTGQRLHSVDLTISNLDSLADGDHVMIRIYRNGQAAADTMTGDAICTYAQLSY